MQVIRSFYNYLLYHNVCPEYKTDILACRDFCDVAEKELIATLYLQPMLPGAFNVACSVVTSGQYRDKYVGDKTWAESLNKDEVVDMVHWNPRESLNRHKAILILKTVFCANASTEQFQTINKGYGLRISDQQYAGLEVTGIEYPDNGSRGIINNFNQISRYKMKLQAVGIMKCRRWKIPSFTLWDTPAAAKEELMPDRFEFWAEVGILDRCFVGMKFEALIRELEVGLWHLDQVMGVYCSFFDSLPNELVLNRSVYREPVRLDEKGEVVEEERETMGNVDDMDDAMKKLGIEKVQHE